MYTRYKQAFKGIGNQGFLGFYKGNGIGIIHTLINGFFKSIGNFGLLHLDTANNLNLSPTKKIALFSICSTIIDMSLHPLHLTQTRLILQDRRKNFITYKNVIDLWKSAINTKSLYAGVLGHLPLNIILFSSYLLPHNTNNPLWSFTGLIPLIFTYPILTIMRRIEAQSNDKGMLPFKYKGFTNALNIIAKEEGVKALYRGFSANFLLVSSGIFLSIVSQVYSPF